ncbi:MAG TPA: hypothetical protein VGT03_04375 [Candidatus Acidoferrales bacterium]|nr:hypothetical protein [Candidatus Acidoferrales bacterium]
MRPAKTLLVLVAFLALPAGAQTTPGGGTSPAAARGMQIDGIAARIGNDVVTESEVRQLEDYQRLVDGQAQSRGAVIQELVDQWIVRGEAATTNFPHPTSNEVAQEFQTLAKQFTSLDNLQKQMSEMGLTADAVRQMLEKQLYYTRFLNYKFHAAADVTRAQIESYYQKEFTAQLEKRGLAVPPLDKVEAQIRELLTQETINEKAAQWLADAKAKLKIVIPPTEGSG